MGESKGLGNVLKKLVKIQTNLKAPKNQHSEFGNYNYRSCEDILEAIKPLLSEQQCAIFLTDAIKFVGERYYVEATATIFDIESEESFTTVAYAREEEKKDRMDRSQSTGAASSYARKYALNGLFAIDDAKDADGLEPDKPKSTTTKSATLTSSVQYESATKTITPAQQKRLFALGKETDIRTVLAEYKIEHTKDIPMSKYDEICKKVEVMKNSEGTK